MGGAELIAVMIPIETRHNSHNHKSVYHTKQTEEMIEGIAP